MLKQMTKGFIIIAIAVILIVSCDRARVFLMKKKEELAICQNCIKLSKELDTVRAEYIDNKTKYDNLSIKYKVLLDRCNRLHEQYTDLAQKAASLNSKVKDIELRSKKK